MKYKVPMPNIMETNRWCDGCRKRVEVVGYPYGPNYYEGFCGSCGDFLGGYHVVEAKKQTTVSNGFRWMMLYAFLAMAIILLWIFSASCTYYKCTTWNITSPEKLGVHPGPPCDPRKE